MAWRTWPSLMSSCGGVGGGGGRGGGGVERPVVGDPKISQVGHWEQVVILACADVELEMGAGQAIPTLGPARGTDFVVGRQRHLEDRRSTLVPPTDDRRQQGGEILAGANVKYLRLLPQRNNPLEPP